MLELFGWVMTNPGLSHATGHSLLQSASCLLRGCHCICLCLCPNTSVNRGERNASVPETRSERGIRERKGEGREEKREGRENRARDESVKAQRGCLHLLTSLCVSPSFSLSLCVSLSLFYFIRISISPSLACQLSELPVSQVIISAVNQSFNRPLTHTAEE